MAAKRVRYRARLADPLVGQGRDEQFALLEAQQDSAESRNRPAAEAAER
jgi:hypothetical protein